LFFHADPTVVLKTGTNKLGFAASKLRLGFPFAMPRPFVSALAFPILFPIVLVQLLWFLRRNRVQIVNLHYPIDNFFYFAICKRLLGIRLVTSIHGRDAFYRESPRKTYSHAFRFLIRSSDLVVLSSATYRNKLLQAFPYAEEKTIHIHNGIDPTQFRPAAAREQTQNGNRYVLCIAELKDNKAIDVLLHAAKMLFSRNDSIDLVLAGDGPLRQQLESLAAALGIEKRTRFLGSKGAADIVQLLHGCEIFVLPSREEPFGIVIIEAMACKKPIVATTVGGIPEIIEHESSGILVAPENPNALVEGLQRVLTDRNLRTRLAENGYTRAMERFCLHHNGAAYESAFMALLGFSEMPPHSSAKISAAS